MKYFITRDLSTQSEVENAQTVIVDGVIYYQEFRVNDGVPGKRGSSADFASIKEAKEYAEQNHPGQWQDLSVDSRYSDLAGL